AVAGPDRGNRRGTARPATIIKPSAKRVHASRSTHGFDLSGREREIAQLVLEGRTYREISEAIFISPRTVEHHIARVRRRLGVTTRSDLLARLRLILGESAQENPLIP
ncbi:helix-turn-helix domain-containing protein, partial [Arthrobacter sp. H41]